MKIKDEKEWMLQAEYDLHAAEKNYKAGIYPFTIFLCHLAIEKALKANYVFKLKNEPPKTHDLSKLAAIINLDPPKDISGFIDKVSAVSVPSRYPVDLKRTLKSYTKNKTESILKNSKKVVEWLKGQLVRP